MLRVSRRLGAGKREAILVRRFAYADPPYRGQAKKHYGVGAREVDFPALVKKLSRYDGWALSVHTNQLHEILSICPKRTRTAAWVKPFAVLKKNVNPAYAWEPIIFKAPSRGMEKSFVHDWVCCSPQMKSIVTGQKPLDVCYFIFQLLGMQPEDKFVDVFPGSGQVQYAWDFYRKNFPDNKQQCLIRNRE